MIVSIVTGERSSRQWNRSCVVLCVSIPLFEVPSVMQRGVICFSPAPERLEFVGDLLTCQEAWICGLLSNSLNLSLIYR